MPVIKADLSFDCFWLPQSRNQRKPLSQQAYQVYIQLAFGLLLLFASPRVCKSPSVSNKAKPL